MVATQHALGQHVKNSITEYQKLFTTHFLTGKKPEKHFQEWTKHQRDVFAYATVCCLGYDAMNGDEITCTKSSANCIHTILKSPLQGTVHMKLVPYESTLDDIRVDAVVGRMISIIVTNIAEFKAYKGNFLQYVCSANMYLKPSDMRLPYKKIFKTNERCGSILFDAIPGGAKEDDVHEKYPETGKGYFKDYKYTKCIVNHAISGHPLDYALKNGTDDQILDFLIGPHTPQFYKLCTGMYMLGKEWGFVNNDAHTGNVFISEATKEFILIDYGRSYINLDRADAKTVIVADENMKHEIGNGDLDLYKNFRYTRSVGVVNGNNLATSLPVMCDIACLSYNIWKRVCKIGEQNVNVEFVKNILKFDGPNIILPAESDKFLSIITGLPENLKAIALGLLWMRCYIIEAYIHTRYMSKGDDTQELLIPIDTIEGTGKPLWNAGQISTSIYKEITTGLNKRLTKHSMKGIIEQVFGDGNQGGGGAADGQDPNSSTNTPSLDLPSSQSSQSSPAPTPAPDESEAKEVIDDETVVFKNFALPLHDCNATTKCDFDSELMMKHYAGYHRYSIAYAEECEDRLARETGNFC